MIFLLSDKKKYWHYLHFLPIVLLYCLIFYIGFFYIVSKQKPRLTVVIIVDQMAWSYLKKIQPFVQGGLKFLLDNGLIYNNAYVPHAIPTTAPGHTGLNMGSFPEQHGIVANKWFDKVSQTKIACDFDSRYPVFSSSNTITNHHGKSPSSINGLGLSESFVLSSSDISKFHVYSISGKSRGAICTANKLGKPLWFDEFEGGFISSTYYFQSLPKWLVDFNKKNSIEDMEYYTWQPYFSFKSDAYAFPFHNNYEFTAPQSSFINKRYPLNTEHSFHTTKLNPSKGRFSYLQNTPFVNERIFNCARMVIENTITQTNDKLLLWLSLSSLDKVGHIMGPSSVEVLDILYHLDNQLKMFFNWIDSTIGLSHALIVFTADHGVTDMPEISRKKGIIDAERIQEDQLINEINRYIAKLCHVDDAVIAIVGCQLYLSASINKKQKKHIEKEIVSYLKTKSYVQNAWRVESLKNHSSDSFELLFKRQMYPERSGDIIFQVKPNILMSHYQYGASHETPYADDTHIPLILYQKGFTPHRVITERVYANQLANTIASILGIPQVQAGIGAILPEVEN